ncbi:MAG TPA: hypothetical protein VK655_00325 [Solirubrobacteraceae bacterium]|jgi:hypothetical protein|nr:hypothetical protein [Solirubrobacteraceae bacterium]
MSFAVAASVIASYRGGSTYAPLYETFVIVPLIMVMTVACVLIGLSLRRRHRRPRRVADQWQALAVMGELCPHGWQAQITLYGWGAPIPADAPPSRVPLVELEWTQFDEEPGQIAVARRVWAPTISDALQSMVEDRRTDFTLEQIEQAAAEEDPEWGD